MLIDYVIAAALALTGLTGALVLTQEIIALHSAAYHLVIADNLLGEIEARYVMSSHSLQELTRPCGDATEHKQGFCFYLEAGLRSLPASRIEVLGTNQMRLSWSETNGEQISVFRALPVPLSPLGQGDSPHGYLPDG